MGSLVGECIAALAEDYVTKVEILSSILSEDKYSSILDSVRYVGGQLYWSFVACELICLFCCVNSETVSYM
jgi:hypothetical protein